jgi:osmotically-inducible protein OsmY
VEANGDGVLLTGGVDSPEAKQRAEMLAGSVEGVGPVTNELQVVRSENLGELPRQTTDRI